MDGPQALTLSCLKENYVSQWEASLTFVQSGATKLFSHAPNELISATVDYSNLTSTASQLPTSKGLTPPTLHDSMSVLGIPKEDYQFI